MTLKTKKLRNTILERDREIEQLKDITLSLEGLDKIVAERDREIARLKKIISDFGEDEKNYVDRNFELEKLLAFEKGRLKEASKPRTITKNYKCTSTVNKLMALPIDNIKPFTVSTIKDNLEDIYNDITVLVEDHKSLTVNALLWAALCHSGTKLRLKDFIK